MVEQRKEATVDTSKTLRILAATAVVSALAILLTSPAQAYLPNEGGGSVATPTVGNPGDSAWIALEPATASQTVGNPGDSAWIAKGTATGAQTVGNPGDGAQVSSPQIESAVTSSGSDGFDTGTFIAFASGAVLLLALGAGALLFTARHRRVALP